MKKRLLLGLTAIVVSGLFAVSASAATVVPAPSGTLFVVNNGPGDQTNPHVGGNLVSYTDTATVPGSTVIRYHNLVTGADSLIPNSTPGAQDYLSDIDGTRIVFTRSTPDTNGAIMLFDASAPASQPVELAHQQGSARTYASIGGNTVAWADLGITIAGNPEIVAYDLSSALTTQLTTDGMFNTLPAVSPDGNVIVWLKCDPNTGSNCDVWEASRTAGTWTTKQLTFDHDGARPDTNGSVVVYSKGTNAGDSNVFVQPVGGGTEENLTSSLGGGSANPSLSANLVAFEHTPTNTSQADIWIADWATGAAFPLTNTPSNETLTDIFVSAGGLVDVVWVNQSLATGADVLGFSYSVDAPLTVTHSAAGASHLHAAAGVTFTDADPAGNLAQYSATIDWGDGTSSPGVVVANPFGGFAAGGLHTYSSPGTYTVMVTVRDAGGATASSTSDVTAMSPPVIMRS